MPKKMFLIDGSNHAFRVQYALPPMNASDGFPTRALYGFTNLFAKVLREHQPDYVVVSFDKGKTWVRDWVYWYHEFVYVTAGRGKVTLSAPPYATSEETEVKAGDLFTIPPSMKVSFEALGDETFEIVWAVPE